MHTINFELSKTFKYSNNSGAEIECSFVELREPTGKVSHLCCGIEGIIQTGIMKMADFLDDDVKEQAADLAKTTKEPDPTDQKDGDSILAVLAGGDVDMAKLVVLMRDLFKEVAFMGGEKPITKPRMDDMSHKDFRRMMGVYIANFIMS